jgi:hypothetical protein
MKTAVAILLASGALWAVRPLGAQQPSGPPPVLRIFREEIKEGKGAAHEKTEAAFMQAAARAKYPARILGLTSITGTSLALFLEGHDTFASIADSQATLDTPEFVKLDIADAELRTSQRSILATYRADLSHGVDKINIPRTRFFSVETIRVRQGQEQKFVELARGMVAGAQKSGDNKPVATYQVVSGAPNGAFLLLEPMESLKSMDEAPERDRAIAGAMGGSRLREIPDTIANEESILFAVSPTMSFPSKEWVEASPEFWGHKSAAPASAATDKKPATKTTITK